MKFILASLLALCICHADEVDDMIRDLRKEIAVERTTLAKTRQSLATERGSLNDQLAKVDVVRAKTADQLNTLERTAEQLSAKIDEITQQRVDTEDALSRCLTVLRETRKDLQTPIAKAAPASLVFAATDAELNRPDPREDALFQTIFDEYLKHLDACTTISRRSEPVIFPSGDSVTTDILVLGGVAAFSIAPSREGLLESVPTETAYRLVPIGSNASFKTALTAAADPTAALRLPIDVSGGRGLKRLVQSKSLIDFLRAGGPIVIPLLVLGFLALIMVIERTVFLLKVDKNLDHMLGAVLPPLETLDFDGAMSHVEGKRGPVANVVRSALQHGRGRTEKLEELLQEGILAELPALERFLGALAVMAAAAPLLGLLGTVSGMIGTFEVISSYGTGNARLLSGGISEALITTEIGLIIAVPILLAHAFLNRQVRIIVGHMDRAALSLAGTIRHAAREDTKS